MKATGLITVDPEILGGTPVFTGTRVPVRTLFDYLEDNYTLDEFLECFPTITRSMAVRIRQTHGTSALCIFSSDEIANMASEDKTDGEPFHYWR